MSASVALYKYLNRRLKKHRAQKLGIPYEDDIERNLRLLREDKAEDDDTPWTEDDEKRFCDELFNVQLEKVSKFQEKVANELKERADAAFDKLRDMAPVEGKPKGDITASRLKELREEIDAITK